MTKIFTSDELLEVLNIAWKEASIRSGRDARGGTLAVMSIAKKLGFGEAFVYQERKQAEQSNP